MAGLTEPTAEAPRTEHLDDVTAEKVLNDAGWTGVYDEMGLIGSIQMTKEEFAAHLAEQKK